MNVVQPGAIVGGDFKVIRRLAGGSMGTVYLAEQVSTGRQRALKFMSPELLRDERSRERFVQEARVGSKVQSDHVVEIVAAGNDESIGMPWIAMELLEGETLAAMSKQRGALPVGEVFEFFTQLCHGLAAAHRAGMVHRDLKPENIFLAMPRRSGVPFMVKILDFGIAKILRPNSVNATQALGTPLWTAPEQLVEGGRVHTSTDVWPLGLIAFKLLTGKYYWKSLNDEGALTLFVKEISESVVVAPSIRAKELGCAELIPAGFDDWFLKCVNRDIDQRYPDAGAALEGLNPVLASIAGPRLVAPAISIAAPARVSDSVKAPATNEPSAAPLKTGRSVVWVTFLLGILLILALSALLFHLR